MARQTFESMLHALHNELEFSPGWRNARWQPRVDIYYDEETFYIQVEAPGLDESTMRVQLEDGHLIVEGIRSRPADGSACQCLQMEIEYGPFRRRLPLPAEIDTEAIQARLEAGFLLIAVPRKKAAPATPTRIDVQ